MTPNNSCVSVPYPKYNVQVHFHAQLLVYVFYLNNYYCVYSTRIQSLSFRETNSTLPDNKSVV